VTIPLQQIQLQVTQQNRKKKRSCIHTCTCTHTRDT
jgi:hypothetical protein